MHLQILIIDGERCGRRGDRTVDRFKTVLEQILVVINSAPTFTIKGVGDVKLRLWIILGRVSTLPFVTRGAELIATKESKRRVKFLLVYLVGAGRNLSSGCNFLKTARLSCVYSNDRRGVN